MNQVALIFMMMTIFVHTLAFIGESIFWMEPVIYEQVISKFNKITNVNIHDQAGVLEVLFFNQGFYNLFVALGGRAGIVLFKLGECQAGHALSCYVCFFALGASIVLASSTTAYIAALIQGIPPAMVIVSLYLSRKNINRASSSA